MDARSPLASALFALFVAACKKEEIAEVIPVDTPRTEDAAKAPDHLTEVELVEGTEKAYGLVLPRNVKIDNAFVNVIYASGDPRPDAVANYIRARVRMGTVQIGAANTLFEKVQVPANPGHEINIRVAAGDNGRGCVVELREAVPPPKPLPGTDVDRFRAVGISPDGKLLDPTHLK